MSPAEYSTNIILVPGPNLDAIAKVAEVIGYKTTAKMFFGDRKLHVQLHRPLTPGKVEQNEEKQDNVKKPEENRSTLILLSFGYCTTWLCYTK